VNILMNSLKDLTNIFVYDRILRAEIVPYKLT
jgi:hypothetical protein